MFYVENCLVKSVSEAIETESETMVDDLCFKVHSHIGG